MQTHTDTKTFLAEAAIAVPVACRPLSRASRPEDDAPALARRHVS
jgi:hypothetical protein